MTSLGALRLTSLLATALVAALVIGLDYIWVDRRTRLNRRLRRALPVLAVLSTGLQGWTIWSAERHEAEAVREQRSAASGIRTDMSTGFRAIEQAIELQGMTREDAEALLGMDKRDDDALRRIGEWRTNGRSQDALNAIARIKAKYSGVAGLFLEEGVTYWMLGKGELAAASFETARRLNPGSSAAWSNLANMSLLQGDVVTTQALLDSALARDRKSVPALIGKANAHVLQRDLESAEVWARGAVATDSCAAWVWYTLAHIVGRRGGDVEERYAYRRALALDSTMAIAWYNLGASLGNADSLGAALSCFSAAIRFEGNDADAWCSHGHCLEDLGRPVEAESSFRSALALDPRHEGALLALGTNLGQRGHHDSALVYLDHFVRSYPDAQDGWVNRGVALRRLGWIAASRESFRRGGVTGGSQEYDGRHQGASADATFVDEVDCRDRQ